MQKSSQILAEAVLTLEKSANLPIQIAKQKVRLKGLEVDAILEIAGHHFFAEVKNNVSTGSKSAIYDQLNLYTRQTGLPAILLAKYIPLEIANEYAANGFNYIDEVGNCHIQNDDLFIHIEGKKRNKNFRVQRGRAFQEAGIRIIFLLLENSRNVELTYRELAHRADVSIGSVSTVMQELTQQNFILSTKKGKVLKNKIQLLDRWVIAYNDVLRPRLILKKMRIPDGEPSTWEKLPIDKTKYKTLWGAEPAASILTNYLSPELITLYTDGSWLDISKSLGLIPSDNGPIELLEIFWRPEAINWHKNTVHPLLVYADLMGSSIGRNLETAKIILENELSYLQ